MFDPDLIEEQPPEQQAAIRGAVMTLLSTGVLHAQKERLFSRVLHGSDTEDKEALAERILEYRKQTNVLETLIQLGEQYKEEDSQREQQS
jgi:hypothetical protein